MTQPSSSTWKPVDKASMLPDLLKDEIDHHRFISIKRMEELIEPCTLYFILWDAKITDTEDAIPVIVARAPKLFIILLLSGQQAHICNFLEHEIDDHVFRQLGPSGPVCSSRGLIEFPKIGPKSLQQDLYRSQWLVPPQFSEDTPEYPRSYIPPYATLNVIGSGGRGDVTKVKVGGMHLEKHPLGIIAAVKRVECQSPETDSVMREVATLHSRRHSHVIELFASFLWPDEYNRKHLYLVLTYAGGGDMQNWMFSSTRPCQPQSLEVQSSRAKFIYTSIVSLISALAYIHSEINGLWAGHFDIKPANVLLVEEDGKWVWKLADFGHSRFQSGALKAATGKDPLALGTTEYQPPEYWESKPGDKIHVSFDVFCLGCVFLQLATLIVFGDWSQNQLKVFQEWREYGTRSHKESDLKGDPSFRKNKHVIEEWTAVLKSEDGDVKLSELLDIIAAMMDFDRKNRIMAFDAALDIVALLNPAMEALEFGNECGSLVKGHGPNEDKFGPSYNPLSRARSSSTVANRQHAEIRVNQLIENGWPDAPGLYSGRASPDLLTTVNSISNLPRAFVGEKMLGREHHIDELKSRFASNPAAVVALYGLGGMGKSFLAWQYARIAQDEARKSGKPLHTFWVQYQNMSTFERSYKEIARKVGLSIHDGTQTLEAVQDWLSDPVNGRWLLIIDGMEAYHTEWRRYCPWKCDSIIVTTKDRGIAVNIALVHTYILEIGALDTQKGSNLLLRLVEKRSSNDKEYAAALASKLHLPLLIKLTALRINHDAPSGTTIESMYHKVRNEASLASSLAKQNVQQHSFERLNPGTTSVFSVLFGLAIKYEKLFRLLCFFAPRIDMTLFSFELRTDNCEKGLIRLTNLGYLTRIEDQIYDIHELVRIMFLHSLARRKGSVDVWKGHLRALDILRANYDEDRKQQNISADGDKTPIYLLKLKYKVHVEEFLKYLRLYPFLDYQYKVESAQAVVTFARMMRDEKRHNDAEFLLKSVIDRGIQGKKAHENLIRVRRTLINVYRVSATGRDTSELLQKALEQAEIALGEVGKIHAPGLHGKVTASYISVLHDLGLYERAKLLLEHLANERPADYEEACKHDLRVWSLKASLYRLEGSQKRDISQLKESRKLWQDVFSAIPESSYATQEKQERRNTARKECANTCLTILEVLSEADFDAVNLGKEVYNEASNIFEDLLKETEKAYKQESRKLTQHKHIYDAEVDKVATNLRYGIWQRNKSPIEECARIFKKKLHDYTNERELGLERSDKDVRRCAYFFREALRYLIHHTGHDPQYDHQINALEKEYDMTPFKTENFLL